MGDKTIGEVDTSLTGGGPDHFEPIAGEDSDLESSATSTVEAPAETETFSGDDGDSE